MSFSSSTEYCASSTLRWLSASRFAGCCWTRKLRNGSRFRSLSTKSFSVYSGPRSWGGRAFAAADDAAGAVRLTGGGGVDVDDDVVVGPLPHATAASAIATAA